MWGRSTTRVGHLLLAVALGVYLYSPLGSVDEATLLAQVVLFPLLSVTGLLLWKGPRLRRWYRRRRPSDA